MEDTVRRLFVETRSDINVKSKNLLKDLRDNLKVKGIDSVRVIDIYDIEGVTDEEYAIACSTIFSQPSTDILYDEAIELPRDSSFFVIELLPGQYDSRAGLAQEALYVLTQRKDIIVHSATLIVLEGDIADDEFVSIKEYLINPVECRETSLEKPSSLKLETETPDDVEILDGFIDLDEEELKAFLKDRGLAMSMADLKLCQEHFKDIEERNPTITEIRVLDTYWSDHCRHTTFSTHIKDIKIENTPLTSPIEQAFNNYLKSREYLYGSDIRPITLMDIATIGMKELKKRGILDNLDESEEINAASIVVPVDVDGKEEEWLIMFKNETHNHPTEIEPFGGAATCLGGAIRDPLSGRSYVYQAMRITGSADPRIPIEETLPGKLPQRTITTTAAEGYSSYGNAIGLPAGHVAEIYHEGFMAKRMELGAVIAAAPKENVVRESPSPGDVIILLGGRTGRDGCGGATGSSKAHTETSFETCSAEVQKGNPIEERKIQRLFRKKHIAQMIKKCNDFGAGGVSVAIGELAPGLYIDLDRVPVKYQGLDGTELAISESQERMAVVVDKEDVKKFIEEAHEENLEATVVAVVTDEERLVIEWRGKIIVDILRDFLDTNGATQNADVYVTAPDEEKIFFDIAVEDIEENNLCDTWLKKLTDLNVCSQKGLVERFDSTIGAGTVVAPFGGKYQLTPAESMIAKVPILEGDTTTATIMSHGYNPYLSEWSPFHGGVYSIIEALAKVVAAGGDYTKTRLSMQEYFERLGDDPTRWGKPFAALLGAHTVQTALGIPSIGGKDSMSGSFDGIDVPPTVVAFAVNTVDVRKVISPEFKKIGSKVILLSLPIDDKFLPDFKELDKNYRLVHNLIDEELVLSAHTVKGGGLCEAISKMCFGNMIGFAFEGMPNSYELFKPAYGSLVLEIDRDVDVDSLFDGTNYKIIGHTQKEGFISIGDENISLDDALEKWKSPLEDVFPTKTQVNGSIPKEYIYRDSGKVGQHVSLRPRVLIPVFPGTNGEYDVAGAFERAGAIVDVKIFKNMSRNDLKDSLTTLAKDIKNSQIIVLPGGVSSCNEPENGASPIVAAFAQQEIADAIMEFLKEQDGLMLGLGSGFSALLKLGLLPYGEIRDTSHIKMGLTCNSIGRHVSSIAHVKVVSNNSPWFMDTQIGNIHIVPISHRSGRLVASIADIEKIGKSGQIATQYVDLKGNPRADMPFNPNGSVESIEGITSPDGKILGRLGHPERIGKNTLINIPSNRDVSLFKNAVRYFK